jgi:hypothetical protein
MNRVYESYFAPGRLPARTCIASPAGARRARRDRLLARRPRNDLMTEHLPITARRSNTG